MATYAQIQAKIYRGLGKATKHLGTTFWIYRPNGPDNPISPANLVGPMIAQFDNKPDFLFSSPNLPGKPLRFGLYDATQTQVGDYVTDGCSVFFVASQEALAPPMLVQCERVLSFSSGVAPTMLGLNPAGGRSQATDIFSMVGWPASVDVGTKGERTTANLPDDTRTAWWAIMLPFCPGTIFHMGDILRDDIDRQYSISSAELSSRGWRLNCAQDET